MLFLLLIRLYHIAGPIVDHQSWNQISAASMAKNLHYDWQTWLHPKVDIFPSPEVTSRVYAQEFLLYHIPVALLYELVGVQEWPGRLVSISFGLLGLWYWFLLSRRLFGDRVAFITLIIMGVSPLNWYYHRAVMPDSCMVTAMVAGCYYFYLWLDEQVNHKYLVYSLLWTMAAGLFKIFGLVVGVTYLLLILLRRDFALFKQPKLYVFAILAWLPTLLWIYHVLNLKEGITEFTHINNMNQIRHPELLLSWDFYSRIFLSRLIDQTLTPWAAIFCIIGLFSCNLKDRRYHLPLAWVLGSLLFLIIVQRGNYRHDYYQMFFAPGLALFAAIGVEQTFHWKKIRRSTHHKVLTILFGLFLIHSTKYVYNHFQYDIGSYLTGKKIAELSHNPDDRVLSLDVGVRQYNQLVYYSQRAGWYLWDPNVEALQAYLPLGAKWLGVHMKLDTDFKKYQSLLQQINTMYPKVWEDRNSVDRYGQPVITQVYDLSLKQK
ncbi:MAG: glycosyltransferase family 39 protein [SAR324 cluster bacterium]|nr:glycosyltransferase family 39 protein [SAR324 cluster bacterium]